MCIKTIDYCAVNPFALTYFFIFAHEIHSMLLFRCYPRITDWIYITFGQSESFDFRFLPIFSYGFFVAMGFLVAASLSALEMRRREKLGLMRGVEAEVTLGEAPRYFDTALYFLFGFVLLFKVGGVFSYHDMLRTKQLTMAEYMLPGSDNFLSKIFSILQYGNWITGILGGVFFAGLYYYFKHKEKLPQPVTKKVQNMPSDNIGDLVVLAAVFGVMGSNLFNFLENPDDYKNFWNDPLGSMFSGLSVYGGLICAGAAFAVYAYWKKIHTGYLFDSVAPGFILANGIGRIGCHVSGDGDWGITNTATKPGWLPDWMWSNYYEHNIIDSGVPMSGCIEEHCFQLAQPAYPTPIYEFLMCTAIFVILWSLRKRFTNVPFLLFFAFTILIGIQRFVIEQFRDLSGRDTYHLLGGEFRQSEVISMIMVLVGIIGMIWLWRKNKSLLLSANKS